MRKIVIKQISPDIVSCLTGVLLSLGFGPVPLSGEPANIVLLRAELSLLVVPELYKPIKGLTSKYL